MSRYILKRIGYMFVTLFIITTLTFFLMHSIPGDPLSHMAKKLPEQMRLNYYQTYGLDKPVTTQYAIFLKKLVTEGDLGKSLRYPGRSVTETILKNAKISGQLGFDPETAVLVEGGVEAQTHQALKNLKAILESAGADLENVVKTTVFLMDMNDFAKVNAIYAEYFTTNPPARSAVQVAALPKGGLVEIEAIACMPHQHQDGCQH